MVKKMPKFDWTQRESVRADGYSPDPSEDATQLVAEAGGAVNRQRQRMIRAVALASAYFGVFLVEENEDFGGGATGMAGTGAIPAAVPEVHQ